MEKMQQVASAKSSFKLKNLFSVFSVVPIHQISDAPFVH